jgi:hypothetical protein
MSNDAKVSQESCYSLWLLALYADRARVVHSRVAQASACVILIFPPRRNEHRLKSVLPKPATLQPFSCDYFVGMTGSSR